MYLNTQKYGLFCSLVEWGKNKQFSKEHWHFYETSSNDSDISHINKIILFGMIQKQGQNVMLQRYHIDAYT